MKRFVLGLLCLTTVFSTLADVVFRCATGIKGDPVILANAERNISELLTEINAAYDEKRNLNLAAIKISDESISLLEKLWEKTPVRSLKNRVIIRGVASQSGINFRGVPVEKRENDSVKKTVELSIAVNKKGDIINVVEALEDKEASRYLANNSRLNIQLRENDLKCRQEMLNWIETLWTEMKNGYPEALAQFLKDKNDSYLNRNPSYTNKVVNGYDKFYKAINKFKCNVDSMGFDHLSVVGHGGKKGIYGMTIHIQGVAPDADGWLFCLCDFNDPDKWQIHWATWQTDEEVRKNGVYTLDDFYIP